MHPTFVEEFKSVDAVLQSHFRTAGIDAFALSVLKAERQARRLVTYLVFQYPCFGRGSVAALRAALGRSRDVYFGGFLKGFDAIYAVPLAQLVGAEYERLTHRLALATRHRNKLFHGQLTSESLSRADLVTYVGDLRRWCELLSDAGHREFGYTGFGFSSFTKAVDGELSTRYLRQMHGIEDYRAFISTVLERQRQKGACQA